MRNRYNWEEVSSNVGRDGKKRHGRAESRFGRKCPQMLGGTVKKKDVGGTSGKSILDLSTFHNKRVKKKEI